MPLNYKEEAMTPQNQAGAIYLRVNSEAEARAVQAIYQSYVEGLSFSVIAERLTAEQAQRKATTPHMMARAAIYARTATADQAEQTFAIQAQIHACRKYADECGYEVVGEYHDQGVSGAQLDRPGLAQVRSLIAGREIDVVIVHDLARLTRRAVDLVQLQDELAQVGVTIERMQ